LLTAPGKVGVFSVENRKQVSEAGLRILSQKIGYLNSALILLQVVLQHFEQSGLLLGKSFDGFAWIR
jgi:hypothetical protein